MAVRVCTPPVDRFWRRVLKGNECWEWTGSIGSHGYGQMSMPGAAPTTTHTFSWRLHNGPIEIGLLVLHHCDNKRCVNPAHLFLGSYSDNLIDMVRKGKWGPRSMPRGSRHPKSKLSVSDVVEIRKASAVESTSTLARRFGVSRGSISAVIRRLSWRHVA